MKNLSYLIKFVAFTCFLASSTLLRGQCSCNYNMSFERAAGGCFAQNMAPNQNLCLPDNKDEKWLQCGSWGCGSADIGPGGSINATNKPPTDGKSYLSMECGPNGEGVDMQLCAGGNLVAGTTYCFSIDINVKGSTSNLSIYGSMGSCGATELLWSSPPHSGDVWSTDNFCITPTGNWTHLQFRTTSGSGFYALSIDNWKSTDGKFPVKPTPLPPGCGFSVTATGSTICAGTSGTLTASANGGIAPITYTWKNGNIPGSTISVNPGTTTTYTVIATDNTNATASATAKIIVNPLPSLSVTNPSTCFGSNTTLSASGATTYTWLPSNTNGNTYTTPTLYTTTTYTIAGKDANNCSNTTTAVVLVIALPTISVTPQAVCKDSSTVLTATGANSYLWNTGQSTASITVTPNSLNPLSYTVTGTQNGCSNTAVATVQVKDCSNPSVTVPNVTICFGTCTSLHATGLGGVPPLNYQWSPGGESTSSIVVCPTGTSNYTVTVTDTKGSTGITTAVVTVNPLPTLQTLNSTICAGETATVSVAGANSYYWSTGATNPSIQVKPAQTTTYVVTGNSLGCTSSNIAIVTVNPIPTLLVSSASICKGTSATLTVSGGNTYFWSNGQSGSTITISPNQTTTYTVTSISSNNCTNSITAQVVVYAIPTLTANNGSLCVGEKTTLSVNGASVYSWNPPTFLNMTSGPTVIATPTTSITYSITGTNGPGCSQSTLLSVTVNALPTIRTGGGSICRGNSIKLEATGAVKYIWEPGTLNGSSVTVSPAVTQTYIVTGTDVNGCSDSDSASVLVNPTPQANFSYSPSTIQISEPTVYFKNLTIDGISYVWTFGDDSTSTLTNPIHNYSDSGHYQVCLKATNGVCEHTHCEPLIVLPEWTFYIPNAFSPNGDGFNDFFRGYGTNIHNYEIWIFDRWGNMIYHSQDIAEPWNGAVRNQPGKEHIVQEDVYVYKIRIKDVFEKEHAYIGSVTLIK